MTVIKKTIWDFFYDNKHLCKTLVLHATGHSIESYDMNKTTIEECVQNYIALNKISDKIKVIEC